MESRYELLSGSISSMYHDIQKIERTEMAKFGLKGPHAQYLIAMNRFPEGITAAQLSNICEKDKAAVSRAVSELEKGGLICRANKASTSYRAMLTLTERGKEATAQLIHKAELAVEKAGQGLTEENRVIFYSAFHLIATNLQRMSENGLCSE